MKPIRFPQVNKVWAENQPEFLPLPAYTSDRETISFWKLTWKERFSIFFRGRLWHRQCNFGSPLQAISMSVDTPFLNEGHR